MTITVTPPRRLRRLRRAAAAVYLLDEHGIEMGEKTLRNRNAAGLDPKPVYLGTIPFYTTEELDRFAATAFTDESPVAVTRRRAKRPESDAEEAKRVETATTA